jgi:hypothetical protein
MATATRTSTPTAQVFVTALAAWLVGAVLRRRKGTSMPGRRRRRLSLREEISLRMNARAGIDRFEDYLVKQAAFDEYCRSHPPRSPQRVVRRARSAR